MQTYTETEKIKDILSNAAHVVIIQADNPDGDSLGSALALEQLLGLQGKEVSLFCAVDIPSYLRYLPGWDRVSNILPVKFDASIIVDASTMTLLEKLHESADSLLLSKHPCIVLDHHAVTDNPIPFATLALNDPTKSSVGELIYELAKQLGWEGDETVYESLMSAILGDTQGLTNDLATPDTYRVMADLIEAGVSRAKLEERRREYSKMPESIFRYKGELIKRTEMYSDGRVAVVSIPQTEIRTYSPLYNPAPLIQTDLLQTEGIQAAVVFKIYDNGRVTAAIRCNMGYAIGADLASHFGGGGHPHASGFKIENGRPYNEIKSECIQKATELLDNLTT